MHMYRTKFVLFLLMLQSMMSKVVFAVEVTMRHNPDINPDQLYHVRRRHQDLPPYQLPLRYPCPPG